MKETSKAELRRQAEERLRGQSPSSGDPRSQADMARLVHELEVHQVELEMQNEELQRAHADTDALLVRYSDLYDFAPTGYATLDRDARILQLNLEAARMLGAERSRLVARRLHQYVSEGDRRVFSSFLERVFAGGGREWCEVEMSREGLPPLFARISCLASADGQTCRAALVDITERRRAEELAQVRRDQMLRVLDAVPDGAYVVGQEYELQYVNPALLAKGRPVNGRKCFDYFHGRTEPCPDCVNPQAFAGAATRREYATGAGIVYEIQDVPIAGDNGRPARLVFLHDVTERRQAEQRLRAAQAETQRLLAQSERSRRALLSSVEDERATAAALRQSEERLQMKLDTVLSPDANIEEEDLANILDIPALQSLMDELQTVTGVGIGIRDPGGKELLSTRWQDICTKFHRANPLTLGNCDESDGEFARGLGPGEFRVYRCRNGLQDIITPIFVGGKQVGNVYSGQFFFDDEAPDRAVFAAQAERYGFDKAEYLAALARVPLLSRERVASLAGFLADFSALVSKLSYGNLKLAMTLLDRQRAEDGRRASEMRYTQLVESMRSGVAVYEARDDGKDFVFKDFSHGAELIEQVKREDVIGRSVREVFPGVVEFGLFDVLQRVWRTGKPELHPTALYKGDRLATWRENYVYRLPSGEVVAVYDDVTEQKLAEEELQQQTDDLAFVNRLNVAANRGAALAELQELVSGDLRSMFGLRTAVFYTLTTDRRWLVPRGLVVPPQAQADIRSVTGTDMTELQVDLAGPSPYVEVLESRLPRLFTETADLIRLVESFSIQPHVRRLAPQHVAALGDYSVLLIPLSVDQEQFGLIEMAKAGRFSEHDIERLRVLGTQLDGILDRRLKDEQLAIYGKYLERMVEERTAELEAAQQGLVRHEKLATLGRVAGSVAHELRNPLGAIRNASYFLQQTATDKLDGKQLRHLQLIDEYIERANKAITAILDFTQGRQTQRSACAVRPILERAIVDAALPQGIDVRLKRSTALPHVLVDDEQMVVVFRNLLTNAGQAMAGHGMVRVVAKLQGEFVDVAVTDTGVGITPENMPRLFEPLFTTRDIGVGLGLAICRAFVEGCGGTIEVESEVGKGTTFTVSLPVAPECPRAAAPAAPD